MLSCSMSALMFPVFFLLFLVHLASSAPHKPTSVNATAKNATEMKVTWISPDLCTGITSYSVIYTDMDNNSTANMSCQESKSEDFHLNECNIDRLEEFWNYTFQVCATANSTSNCSSIKEETTLESKPGPVENLTLIPETDPNKDRSINVTWMPPVKRNLNGRLLFYSIKCYDNISKLIEMSVPFQQSGPQTISFKNLTAERMYFISISAITSVGFGTPVEQNTTIASGAPLPPKMILERSTLETTDPRRQLAINLPISDFFCNFVSGSINVSGIIVAQSSRANDNIYKGNSSYYINIIIKNYQSWSDVHDSDNVPPYRATSDYWKPPVDCASYRRKRRSTGSQSTPEFVSYIVGEEKDCKDTHDTYCNGYLKPSTEYKVKIFMCTNNGCTESMWSEVMKTDYDPTVVTAVTVVLVLLIASTIAVVFVLRKKRMMCFKDSKLGEEGTNIHNREHEMTRPKADVHRPIKLSELRGHVENMHRNTKLLFSAEYKELKDIEPKHSTEAAQLQACRSKNRYTNILSFDHSRVKLLPIEDEAGSDYINANYIQGLNGKREYIATQGPLPSTNNDFWRMVWEQKAAIIVMLTKCKENGKIKCDKYWPDVKEPVYYGELTVNVTSESFIHDYVIRVIEITLDKEIRKVFHFSYLNWPDMGCPKDPTSLLNFVTTVRKYVKPNSRAPIIVHCSAGVGRTGTYIIIDYLMQFVQNHDEIDIFHLVYQLRDQRCNMVQTEDQYVFIHDSMVHFLAEDDEGDEQDDHDISPDGENIYENTAFVKE